MKGSLFLVHPPRYINFVVDEPGNYSSCFQIENASDERIAFRIRTNSRITYRTRPNSGFLDAGDRCLVAVELNPEGKFDHKHRFLIQGINCGPEDTDREKFWIRHDKDRTEKWKLSVRWPSVLADSEGIYSHCRHLVQIGALRRENEVLRVQNANLSRLIKRVNTY